MLGLVWPCYGHRPAESSLEARWQHERLEVELVVSAQIATRLLGNEAVPLVGASSFEAHRAAFEALAPTWLRCTRGGREVSAQVVSALCRADGEVEIVYVFPVPDGRQLVLRAEYLGRVPSDCFCLLRTWADADAASEKKLLVQSAAEAALDFGAVPAGASSLTLPKT